MTRMIVIAILATSSVAAAELSKEDCVEAHSRGQDAKDQGKLTLARKLFLMCSQPACPSLVQNDCARFADDLTRMQPTVSFAARDSSGADLPDTTVYLDDVLVATRLDDGKPHDVDPGKHMVRFLNGGHEQLVTVVIGSGEQGRTVAATFSSARPIAGVTALQPRTDVPHTPRVTTRTLHPAGTRALLIGGLAVAATGLAFGVFELTRVPAGCDLSSHQCAAAPGDPVFGEASRATELANYGWTAAGLGLVTAAVATVWYVGGARTTKERLAVAPWIAPNSGGLVLAGPL